MSRVRANVEALLRTKEADSWQQQLTDIFYDPDQKRNIINLIRSTLPVDAGLSADEADVVRNEVVAALISNALRTATPPRRDKAEPLLADAELEDLVIEQYPHPIAATFRSMTEQRDPAATFGCLLDTFEASVHFLFTVAASAYLDSPLSSDETNRLVLQKLLKENWSAGDLLELLTFLLANNHDLDLAYPRLAEHFSKDGKATASFQVFSSLLEDRNRLWGHGTGRDSAMYQAVVPRQKELLQAELARLTWLVECELIRPVEITDTGLVERADILRGERIRRARPFQFKLKEEELEHNGGRIRREQSLLLVNRERGAYWTLFPLSTFVLGLRNEGMYFLRELRWSSSERGRRLRKATYVAYEASNERHEERPGDRAANALEQWVGELEGRLQRTPPVEPVKRRELDPSAYTLSEVALEQQSHLRTFVGRQPDHVAIDSWVRSTTHGYMLVTAPPGHGKSAFMAHLAERYRRDRPCLLHMVKSNSNPLRFVAALIAQAAQFGDLTLDEEMLTGGIEDLRNNLIVVLQRLVQLRGNTVVVIDALDELSEPHRSQPDFLPAFLPDGVHIVLSSRPHVPLVSALRLRLTGILQQDLPALALSDFDALLAELLPPEAFRRVRDFVDVAALFKRLQGNALLLRRATQLIRESWRDERVCFEPFDVTSLPTGLADLFTQIYEAIGRQPTETESRSITLLLQLLSVARESLTFGELAELATISGTAISAEAVRALCLRMSEYLLHTASDRVKPWHEGLSEFVRDNVLAPMGVRRLEQYFCEWTADHRTSAYALKHRIGHLVSAERRGELVELLLDQSYWEAKVERDMTAELVLELELGASLGEPDGARRVLELLGEALRADMRFIVRHPQTLFQWMWNRCYWHDSKALALHVATAGELPVPQVDPEQLSLSSWVDEWKRRAANRNWVESLFPPIVRLGCGHISTMKGLESPQRGLAVTNDGGAVVVEGWREWLYTTVPHGSESRCHDYPDKFQFAGFIGSGDVIALVRLGRKASLRAVNTADGALVWERPLPSAVKRTDDGTVFIAPSGKWLAVGNKGMIVVDLKTSKATSCVRPTDDGAWSPCAFTADGQKVIAERRVGRKNRPGRTDLTAIDLTTKRATKLDVPGFGLTKVAAHPTEEVVAATTVHTAVIVDVRRPESRTQYSQDQEWNEGAAFSPDGRLVAFGGKSLTIWSRSSSTPQARFEGHLGLVRSVAFFPDGKRVASASDDGTVRVWDVSRAPGEGLALLVHPNDIMELAFSPTGRQLASVDLNGDALWVWDVATGQNIARVDAQLVETGAGVDLLWVDESRLVVIDGENNLSCVDLAGKQPSFHRRGGGGFTLQLPHIAVSPDGRRLAHPPYVIDIDTGVPDGDPISGGRETQLVWSPDGKYIISAGEAVVVMDASSRRSLWRVSRLPRKGQLHRVAVSTDGTLMCVVGRNVSVWSLGEERCLMSLDISGTAGWTTDDGGLTEPMGTPYFSADGSRLVVHYSLLANSRTWVIDVLSRKVDATIEGVLDPWVEAEGNRPWRARGLDSETIIETRDGVPFAWAPPMDHVKISPHADIIAGAQGRQLYLFKLHRSLGAGRRRAG